MAKSEVIKLEIPSSAEYVAVARKAMEGFASRLAMTSDQIGDLELAVGEACTNAVKYSRPRTSKVEVLYRVVDRRLEIEVRNSGKPFDVHSRRTSPPQPNELVEGGLGLFVIDNIMDRLDISCRDGRTTLKMIKNLQQQAV